MMVVKKTTKSVETKICSACGKDTKLTEYYVSNSKFNKYDSKTSVCKACVWKNADVRDNKFSIDKIKDTLRMIDKPFIKSLWETSLEESIKLKGKPDVFKVYMKNIAMGQYTDKNWSHSDNVTELVVEEDTVDNYEYTQDDINQLTGFFGRGYSVEDYIWLNEEYQEWLGRYECDSKASEILIKQITLTELDIEKRRALGEKVDAQLKTLQDLLGSSNLKPVQAESTNVAEQEVFGTLIRRWENEKPIPEADPKWADVDGIKSYMNVFFTGHLANMLGKLDGEAKAEYEKEMAKYTVEEPDREIEDDDDDFLKD